MWQKNPIRRFRAFDCHNSLNEFAGWTRTETDYYWHQLETVILESGVMPYGIACARQDWDDLVTGEIRAIYGNAEQMCIKNVFVKALQWAEQNTFDPLMSFVFDSRPSDVQKEVQIVTHAFQTGRPGQRPSVVGAAFLSSYQILPLQAADLIAWELYQFANDIHDGATVPGKPLRKQLQYLLANKPDFQAQFATRQSIKQIIDYVIATAPPGMLSAGARHFTTFDPSDAIQASPSPKKRS